MTDTTIDAGKMTKDELNRWLELHLFNDALTANTPVRMTAAIKEWNIREGIGHTAYEHWCKYWMHTHNFERVIWNLRERMLWHAEIESHVAAHRFPPRDLAGTADGMMTVLKAMYDKGWSFLLCHHDTPGVVAAFKDDKQTVFKGEGANVKELPIAVARAAVAALESEATNG